MGVRSYPPRIGPPECLKGYSIPCQLIETACLVLLDLAWEVIVAQSEVVLLSGFVRWRAMHYSKNRCT